ncbi:unnamed protein product [Thelazia callipaeda]|uniref:C2H2-type domain-containing protein n=1 Tax=Thelazia callipaeda TaxID=103827 RepID=A0A0N5CZX9_THECL|nr:unnamed protein product [Thelazia callipaeda]
MFRCIGCPLSASPFDCLEELEIHIAADHISHVPYECERCRFSKFPTEFALIIHCTVDHGLKEFYVKYKLTPDFHRKREQIKEMLQQSITISKIPFANVKRRKLNDCSLPSSTGEPCTTTSVDSDELNRGIENEKEAKFGDAKNTEMEPDNSAQEKDLDVQPSSCAADYSRHDSEPVNIGGYSKKFSANILTDLYHNETASTTVVTGLVCDQNEIDHAAGLTSTSEYITQARKRSRPPRICNICGLQVTGQRSSLIYHANSKHVRLPMFFCRECKKTWTTITKSDVIKHVKACHDGNESLIEDHRMQYAKDLHLITDKCFPRKSRGII